MVTGLHQLSGPGTSWTGPQSGAVFTRVPFKKNKQKTTQTLILYFGPFSFHLSSQKIKTSCLTFYKLGPYLVPTLILLKGQYNSI